MRRTKVERLDESYAELLRDGWSEYCRRTGEDISFIEYSARLAETAKIPLRFKFL